jgi:hypothetical protein
MTTYATVYGMFLAKVDDFDLADMVEDDATTVMADLLKQAVGKFSESCKKDLSDIAETEDGWNADLDDLEIDILSELMVEAWHKPRINNLELYRSKLSTKDFTTFSPANLLKETREAYEQSHKRARSMINEYSFRMNNIGELK